MFETHILNEKGFEEVAKFKSKLISATKDALELMPESREKSLFLTNLEQALFFGTKAIASKEENFKEIISY